MLMVIDSVDQLPYGPIMDIYECSNREKGRSNYPHLEESEQLLLAEQDFYAYLQDVLERRLAVIALWSEDGRTVAALRLEKYCDGLLLAGIETAPDERRKGYASALVRSALDHFSGKKIYSHIFEGNYASTALHKKCGFRKLDDLAVLLDGSIMCNASTYLYG